MDQLGNNVNYATWGWLPQPAALMTVTTGTLLIDLIDTKNNNSVWRGVAKDKLTDGPTATSADAMGVEN